MCDRTCILARTVYTYTWYYFFVVEKVIFDFKESFQPGCLFCVYQDAVSVSTKMPFLFRQRCRFCFCKDAVFDLFCAAFLDNETNLEAV